MKESNMHQEATNSTQISPTPPLAEIVFEIAFNDSNIVNYDLLIGELYSKLKSTYPIPEPLKPKEVPPLLMPFIIQQRFRSVENGYPLYQLGPGIMSFNTDGDTYHLAHENKWETFRTKLLEFLAVYKDILGDKFQSENFKHISLRFINKIEDTDMYPNVKNYFSNQLNLKIDLGFADDIAYITNLEDTKLSQTYYLDQNKKSKLNYNLGTITEGSRKLLADISVTTTEVPTFEGLQGWLDNSHSKIENFFNKMTQGITSLQ